ncbi:MAG: putative porin [Bacteroidales bacterium]|nr:putative porin [Bacteroidales bacterium]
MKRLLLIILALAVAHTVSAQADTSHADSKPVRGLEYHKEEPDSVKQSKVHYFFYTPAQTKINAMYMPQLSPTGMQFNDPLDELNGNYYLSVGVIGHPHLALYSDATEPLGLRLITDRFTGYAKRLDNVRFYQTRTPYSLLSYNSSLNKDYVIRATHTQNIMPGWNASFDYTLVRPEGVFTGTYAKDHFLDATTNYFSRDSRLQAKAAVIWNSMRNDENGGITDDGYFTGNYSTNYAGMPVNIYDMQTRHNDLTLMGGVNYSLVPQFERYRERDSIAVIVGADSTISYDTIAITDTIPAHKPKMLNAGTLGIEVIYDRRKRVAIDSTMWREYSARLFWTNDVYPDHRWRNPVKVTVGLQPRYIFADIEGDSLGFRSWIDPFARAEVALGRGSIVGEAESRNSFNAHGTPDSRFAATLTYPFDSLHNNEAEIKAVHTTRTPDLRMLHYNKDLDAVVTSYVGARYHYKDVVDISLQATHYNHNTWFDTTLLAVEGTSPFWLYQARLTTHLKWGWLHLDMQHLIQHSTDTTQMPVPLLATKNSFYTDIVLIKDVLRAQIGVDLRYHSLFFSPNYDPYTGLFYHQRTAKVGGYIWGDVFLNLQLKRAVFYVKAGHLNALWEEERKYFSLPHYPGQGFGLFYGITWSFFD